MICYRHVVGYLWYFSLTFYAVGLKHYNENIDHNKYLIDTPGCKIHKFTMNYTKTKTKCNVCGTRRIFIKKVTNNMVTFHKPDYHENYKFCYYQFKYPKQSLSTGSKQFDIDVSYGPWQQFKNGTRVHLKSDFIKVQCYRTAGSNIPTYDDIYAIVNKVEIKKRAKKKRHWNVLMIGLDTLSRSRAFHEFPMTTNYFKKEGWMDFKGYNKMGDNTFPNLVSVLTNKNHSSILSLCRPDLYKCNEAFIWSSFKNAEYVTAFGEDCIHYFNPEVPSLVFRKPPTDHYIRTLFLRDEKKKGPNVCTKTKLSVKHILSYAYDFVNTYKYDKYFGVFWVNSLSHDEDQSPASFDGAFMHYFQKLVKLDVLKNSFIIFFSDHGKRYGDERKKLSSFHETRLPMLFMKIPQTFRRIYPEKYALVYQQQTRLIVPFDLHLTLTDIASNFEQLSTPPKHEGCSKCHSLFGEITYSRTCADAGITNTWCACNHLQPVSISTDYGATYSLQIVLLALHNITKNIQTKPSTFCQDLILSKIINVHKYEYTPKVFYVIAGTLLPDETGFEATISKQMQKVRKSVYVPKRQLTFQYQIELLEITTSYSRPVNCVMNHIDRKWCVCGSNTSTTN